MSSALVLRTLFALVFVVAGPLHFILPDAYERIMPPYLPAHRVLIYVSGVAEFLGGLGLLVPVTRHAAAWGLVVLLLAVWPANIYMAAAHLRFSGMAGQNWAQWMRVVLQVPLIWAAWRFTRE